VSNRLIASRSIFALLGSGTGPASQAYVADRTTHAERTAGVAFLNAAMGLGETMGPGFGSMLAVFGVAAPLYFAAGLAVASAGLLWCFLPEETSPHASARRSVPPLRLLDVRVLPFLGIAAALQAVRATTTITLSLFFQDTLGLDAATTVRDAGIGFVVLAAALASQIGRDRAASSVP
jgi:MFS family permease